MNALPVPAASPFVALSETGQRPIGYSSHVLSLRLLKRGVQFRDESLSLLVPGICIFG